MQVSWGEIKRRKMSQPAVGARRVPVIAVVQLLSRVKHFVTPRIAAFQVSLSSTIPQGLHKFMAIQSVMLSNHLIFWHSLFLLPSWLPSIFPSTKVFSNNSASNSQSIGVSASATILPMNIQDWFPLGWTGLISLLSKGLSRVFSNTTIQRHHWATRETHGEYLVVAQTRAESHRIDRWKNAGGSEQEPFLLGSGGEEPGK